MKDSNKLPIKRRNRCLAAIPSTYKTSGYQRTVCYDVRNYSWQVAPLQSLFPLHSGTTNIMCKK